ncbi:hypothetical protein OIO90_004434 [Microbotryomycetes sp. JL221]|nr:hypothetical protein OIO90_004434 [Microbotryomycetes sp. JL221]
MESWHRSEEHPRALRQARTPACVQRDESPSGESTSSVELLSDAEHATTTKRHRQRNAGQNINTDVAECKKEIAELKDLTKQLVALNLQMASKLSQPTSNDDSKMTVLIERLIAELAQNNSNIQLRPQLQIDPKMSVRNPGKQAPPTAFREAPFDNVRLVPRDLTVKEILLQLNVISQDYPPSFKWTSTTQVDRDREWSQWTDKVRLTLACSAHVTIDGLSSDELDIHDDVWCALDDIGRKFMLQRWSWKSSHDMSSHEMFKSIVNDFGPWRFSVYRANYIFSCLNFSSYYQDRALGPDRLQEFYDWIPFDEGADTVKMFLSQVSARFYTDSPCVKYFTTTETALNENPQLSAYELWQHLRETHNF